MGRKTDEEICSREYAVSYTHLDVYKRQNVYDSEIQALRKARIAARKEKKVDLPKDNHSGEKAAEGNAADTEKDAGHDSGQTGI